MIRVDIDMSMPNSCFDCILMVGEAYDGECNICATNCEDVTKYVEEYAFRGNGVKPSWCPLEEVE
jgi:hypothetical protein